jgi:hypothetical protein
MDSEEKLQVKKLVTKLTIMGIGVHMIYRFSYWSGLAKTLSSLVKS